jgi:rRNA maturation protein Nop10
MEIRCLGCGSDEFVSKPNRYDIYKVIDKKLVLSESAFVDEEFKLFCRECGEEYENAEEIISA